jgi:hypothetical protein
VPETDADVLLSWAASEQGIDVPRERAARIAKSLAPVKAAVAAAARTLPFEAEPSSFLKAQAALWVKR